ncbi:MAG: hemolysin III family protein [Vulcanimicrobiota bacterium]
MTTHQETPPEEIANSITHGLGFALASLGLYGYWHWLPGRPLAAWGACLFAGTLAMLYLFSALYHACPRTALKPRLQRLDHLAIFFFIAGSYTPYCVLCLPDALSAPMLALVWSMAAVGGLFSLTWGTRYPTISMVLMLLMGWMAIFLFPYFQHALSMQALGLLLAGGLSYTMGTLFYATHFFQYSHAVWHLFVMAGSACHYASIWLAAASGNA